MATVNYLVKGNKNPSSIFCRFVHTKSIDITFKTNLLVDPKNWDKRFQKIKNVIAVKNRNEVNKSLSNFKTHIIDEFNNSYIEGKVFDKNWIQEIAREFFNRPKDEFNLKTKLHNIYYTDFSFWWIENKSSTWLTSSNSFMNTKDVFAYKNFLRLVCDFELENKLKLIDITSKEITGFIQFLLDNDYSPKTIQRHVKRFRFFCNRAEELGFNINLNFKQRVYMPKPSSVIDPYLNEKELERLNKLDLRDFPTLADARDNLIIACWTGLRISDFNKKLDTSNFIDDYIEISTTKTGAKVVIPVHSMVKGILLKNNGALPKKTSDKDFNEKIKEVCKIAGFKNEIKGRLFDKEKKRKIDGVYPKYKLVSSHIGRRSFATNLFGKISNSVIMKIGGWSTEKIFLDYVKMSSKEHANQLKEHWENK